MSLLLLAAAPFVVWAGGVEELIPLWRQAGYEVAPATDSLAAALRQARKRGPRVVLFAAGPAATEANLLCARTCGAAAVISLGGWSDFRLEDPARPSPVLRIDGSAPPFFLVHGDADPAVPVQQSAHFCAALKNAGSSCELVVIPGGRAPLEGWSRAPWEERALAWLNRILRHRKAVPVVVR